MRSKKTRHLEMTVSAIQQRWGVKALRKLDASAMTVEVPHISTSFPALDQALGIGGLAKGRVSELLGPATSGKTTLALKFLVQAQVDGEWVGYVDHAHCFDLDYAHRCGLDLSRLLVVAPYDVGEALSMTEALVGSGSLAALVFDGLDALWNNADTASLLAACFDRLAAPLSRSGTAALFLHAPLSTVSPGLSALAHHATVRLRIVREHWLRRHSAVHPAHDGDIRGYQARVEVLKNRLGPSGRTVTIAIEFNGTVRGNGL
jgi:recombination protein RecA